MAQQLARRFVQPPDSLVAYADLVQTSRTEEAVLLQFYTTIMGVPVDGPNPAPVEAVTRLVATIVLTPAHAGRLAEALKNTASTGPPADTSRG